MSDAVPEWRFYSTKGAYPKAFFDAITEDGRVLELVWPNAMRWKGVADDEIVFVRPAGWPGEDRLTWDDHADTFGYEPDDMFLDLDEIERSGGLCPPAAWQTLHRLQKP